MESSKKSNGFWSFVKTNLAIIIIVTCAIAATLVAIIIKSNQQEPSDIVIDVNGKPDVDTGIVDLPSIVPTPVPDVEDKPTVKPYVLPVAQYTLGMDYSRDSEYVLVFKKTLNEYSVHNGIDFLAEEGTAVVAINDGTVTAVTNDFGMGWTVEITHDDGYVSYYSSLGEDLSVSVGDTVECGETIGCVANTATYESLEGSHLHFELKKDGNYVNPRDILDM